MASPSMFRRGRGVAAGAGVALALVAGSLSSPAQAAPAPAASAVECPAAVPQSSIAAGMVGKGWTVVTGTEPQPFRVEVLGILENGMGADRDLVMIKVSDLPGGEVISQAGGIWGGMSGSPVYVDGRLLGAISGGYSLAPSVLGTLTPAADMFDVLNLGEGPAAAKRQLTPATATIKVSPARVKAMAARAGEPAPRGALTTLRTPFGVNGLGKGRLGSLQEQLDRSGRKAHVYAAGSAGASKPSAVPQARPVAGGNFAAVLASGDLTAFYTGTTTAVCGDRAVAFGHYIDRAGPSSYAAAGGQSVAIIEDKTLGSFKLMNLGPSFGTVDQDRTSAIRADLTRTPAATGVTTLIRSADTGKARTGSTQVYDSRELPWLTASAIFAGQDAVFDEWNDGTAHATWKIAGTRAGGRAFSVTRANLWASQDDSTIDPAVDVAIATDQLLNNDYENVTIDSVTFDARMATTYNQLRITKLEVAVGDKGKFTTPKRLVLSAGNKIKVRISTAPYRSTKATTTTVSMTVPAKARGRSGALLSMGGVDLAESGGYDEECVLFGEDCGDSEAGSLNAVIKSLTAAPKNNAIQTELLLEDEDEDENYTVAATKTVHKGLTVTGYREIPVVVRR